MVISPGMYLLFLMVFIILFCFVLFCFCCFPYDLRISLSRFFKYYIEVLMAIALNLQISFVKMAIFTIYILPIHKHLRSFHVLISFSHSFFIFFKFLSYRFFTFLVRVTTRYCISFMSIVKDVVSLTSFSACLPFV